MQVNEKAARHLLSAMGLKQKELDRSALTKKLNRLDKYLDTAKAVEGDDATVQESIIKAIANGEKVTLEGKSASSEANGDDKETPTTSPAASKGKKSGTKPPKAEKAAKTKPEAKKGQTKKGKDPANGKMSGLDAAFKVLSESGKPMSKTDLVEAMEKRGYWTSPGGKTPADTIKAAIHVEINKKGKEARFTIPQRGMFAAK